jgi:hypothetical protein
MLPMTERLRVRVGFVALVTMLAGCGQSSTGNAGVGDQCKVAADCGGGGKVCVSGVCNMPGLAAAGAKCTATRDCALGLYCSVGGTCAMGGMLTAGATCTADGDCQAPLRCAYDGFFGTCAMGGSGEAGSTCAATADCLAPLWCGADKTCAPISTAFPPFAGASCHDEGAFRVYFEVPRPTKPPTDFFRLPFPNDARVAGGKLDMSDFPDPGPTPLGVDLVKLYVDTWTADFDGFSDIAAITFRFSADIDFSTTSGDSVRLIDVTPGPSLGRLLGRSWEYSPGRTKYSCLYRFTLRNSPAEPMEPGHTYAAFLTTAFRSKAGDAPVVDPDLAAVLGATPPSDASLSNAWNAYKPLRDWAAMQGAMAPDIAGAAVFTVQDAPGHMQRLAAAVAAQPAPTLSALTLCGPGVTSPCDDGTPDRACGSGGGAYDEIHGRLSVPIFQAGTEPYDTPADGGGIVETAGAPVVARTENVCFALSIPRPPAVMPAGGWPLVVYGHGTGGSMRSFIGDGVAGAMAGLAAPVAVLGFDEVEHGARRGASTKKPDDLVFNPLNPRAARDNFVQGAADVLQALRLPSVKLDAAASPTGAAVAFDPTRVAFFGHSQGSTSGELAIAVSSTVQAAVLSGAGSFLTRSLLEKTMPQNIGAGLTFLIGEPLDADHPVMTVFQSFFDRSDPLSYNQLTLVHPPVPLPSKHLLMTWGTGDTYTPRSTLQANGESLGNIPLVAPMLESYSVAPIPRPVSLNVTGGDGVKRTAVLLQYMATGYDGHFVAQMNPSAVADWTAFLGTYFATGSPSLQ